MNAAVSWPDVHGRINTSDSSGRYYNYYSDATGANLLPGGTPGYKASLDVLAASRRKVLVTLNFHAAAPPFIATTAGEVQKAKDTLVDQVNSLWNQRRLAIKLIVLNERGRPTGVSRSLEVQFRLRWTRTIATADYVLRVYSTPNDLPNIPGRTDKPPFVTSATSGKIEMHIAATEPPWTFSHEFGHCIGLPDEYSHPGVRYFRPDGQEGVLLERPAPFIAANKQGKLTPSGRDSDLRTEMSTNPNSNLLPRHLWPTALEVRRLVNLHAKHAKFGVDVDFSR